MALFTLTDVKFTPKRSSTTNNKIVEDEYSTSLKRYPSNLGNDFQYLHYIVFYINTQTKTQFESSKNWDNTGKLQTQVNINRGAIDGLRGAGTSTSGIGNIRRNLANTELGLISSDVRNNVGNLTDRVRNSSLGQSAERGLSSIVNSNPVTKFISDLGGGAVDIGSNILKNVEEGLTFAEQNFFRSTKRTKSAIALYMPDGIQFNYSHNFNEPSVGQIFGEKLTATGQAFNSALDLYRQTGSIPTTINNLSPFIAEAATKGAASITGGDANAMFTAFTGNVVNPQLELLFQSTARRTFSFNFKMTPRTPKEAEDILDIVRLFKFHAAPEILKNTSGRYMIPPSEFDISFFYNGKQNPNIPKISTCVLTNISVDYSPEGWAAFEISNESDPTYGRTGMPVSLVLSLQFQETQIITKEYLSDTEGINSQKSGTY